MPRPRFEVEITLVAIGRRPEMRSGRHTGQCLRLVILQALNAMCDAPPALSGWVVEVTEKGAAPVTGYLIPDRFYEADGGKLYNRVHWTQEVPSYWTK